MLIINTESPTISRTKMIYLYINGVLVDKLKSNQVKQYDLKPGKYQVQVRLNFYLTEPEVVEVKEKRNTSYEITLKSNWRLFTFIIPFMIIGLGINYFINRQFGSTLGLIFIAIYFSAAFYINSRISRKGFLELKKMKK